MTTAADLVGDAPWFGGVHVCVGGRVLLTIGGENPEIEGPPPPRAHVRWIGGGPEPDESFADCALREAREELGGEVELLHSEETVVELRPAAPERRALADRPAPLLVQRYDEGEVLVMYRARLLSEPYPADVERLVWVPLDAVEPLCDGLTQAEAARCEIEVVGPAPDPRAHLFIGRKGAEYLLYRLGVDEPREVGQGNEEMGGVTWDGLEIAREPPHGVSVLVRRRAGEHEEWLLLHRAHEGADYAGDWAWGSPAGARLPREPVDACAARELREETGLELPCLPAACGDGEWAVYLTEVSPDEPIVLSAEHDRLEWVGLEEAVQRCLPARVGRAFRCAARLVP